MHYEHNEIDEQSQIQAELLTTSKEFLGIDDEIDEEGFITLYATGLDLGR